MELKKTPDADLNRKTGLFLNVGLVVSLLLVIMAFEWKFYDDGSLVDLGQVDVTTWGAGDEPSYDRVVADPSHGLVGVAYRGRRIPVGDEVSDPLLDIVETDGPDRHLGEDGKDEAAQIRLIAGLG